MRKYRLKKASLENDSIGLENQIRNALNFNINVSEIEGYADEFNGEIYIKMNNGDTIEIEYSSGNHIKSNSKSTITINGITSELPSDWDISNIVQKYKEILKI